MAKTRERNEVEVVRARNKKLEKENKDLRREVSRLAKRTQNYHDLEERTQELELEKDIEVPKDKTVCPKCGEGKLTVSDLGIRKLTKCNSCGFRKSEK